MRKLLVLIFLLFAFAGLSFAADYYVSNTGINSPWPVRGGANTPWKTITYALSQVANFDTVYLAAGNYGSAEGEVFPLTITKAITIEGQGSAESVIIRDTYGIGLAIISVQTKALCLKNFTVEWIGITPNSVAIRADGSDSSATLDSLRLDGHDLGSYGIMAASNASIKCYRCQLFDAGTGFFLVDQSSFEVINCVIASGRGSGIELKSNASGVVKNSIIYSNSSGINASSSYLGTLSNTYNDVYLNGGGNYINVISGEGSMSIDPTFIDAATHNFRLKSIAEGYPHSYCIDAGDPADSYSNEQSPNGSRINMGVNGNTASAELSDIRPKTYYVNAGLGADTNIGIHPSYPLKTITNSLTRVATDCSVYVAAGLYDSAGNGETFPLTINYPITLSGEGFTITTIEGSPVAGLDSSIVLTAPMGQTTIEGFYLKPSLNINISRIIGVMSSVAGANQSTLIKSNYFNGISLTQTNCLFASDSDHVGSRTHAIKNNIFANASSGTLAGNNEIENLSNNTYYNCKTASQLGSFSSIEAKNNIVVACTSGFTCPAGSSVNCRYNAGYLNGGTYGGGVTIDETDYDGINPYFVSTSEGNFRLMSQQEVPAYPFHSSFIDLGDPTDVWIMEPDPNGGRRNMGVFGGTPNAELSYTGTTTTTTTSTTTSTTTTSTTTTSTTTTIATTTISITTTTSTITTTTTGTTTTTQWALLPGGQIVVSPVVWNRTNPLKMAYKLTADQATRIIIFSSSGTIVFNNQYAAGSNGGRIGYNEINWDGKNPSGNYVGNGVYVVQLIAGSNRIAKGYITVLQ